MRPSGEIRNRDRSIIGRRLGDRRIVNRKSASLEAFPEISDLSLTNRLSSTTEIRGLSPDALTRSRTEAGEKQDSLPREKYALLTPPQDPSPAPSPSPAATKESETLNSPTSKSDRSAGTDEKAVLKQFVLRYLKTLASDDTSLQLPYFGERVNFYEEGVLNSSNIEASMRRYRDKWSVRNWEPGGDAKVARLKDPNLFAVYQPITWPTSDSSNHAQRNAALYLRVRKTSQGEFQILYIRQITADHTRKERGHRRRR